MQDENFHKMSEMADSDIKDVHTLNILLCYLLYKINRPVAIEQLYDIAVGTGVINYFFIRIQLIIFLIISLSKLSLMMTM